MLLGKFVHDSFKTEWKKIDRSHKEQTGLVLSCLGVLSVLPLVLPVLVCPVPIFFALNFNIIISWVKSVTADESSLAQPWQKGSFRAWRLALPINDPMFNSQSWANVHCQQVLLGEARTRYETTCGADWYATGRKKLGLRRIHVLSYCIKHSIPIAYS